MTGISITTVTLNAAGTLGYLISDLVAQTDQNLTWIVFDGVSKDGTPDLVASSGVEKVRLFIERDSGIYDAVHKAVMGCNSEYYLVVGADDRLAPDAVSRYTRGAVGEACADIVAADVLVNGITTGAAGAAVLKVPHYAPGAGVSAGVIRYGFTGQQIELPDKSRWWGHNATAHLARSHAARTALQ